MEKDIKIIAKSLNNLKKLYEDIAILSERKKEAIIKNDVSTLNIIVEQEKEIIAQISDIEEIRQKCSARIGNELGIGYKITLRQIIDNITVNKEELMELLDELNGILDRVSKINNINSNLIKVQLNYIECFKSAFLDESGAGYNMDGSENLDKTQSINLFDRMV